MRGYPSDVTDAEWALLAARPDPRGNPGKYGKREVVNAIFYVVKGGIPWRILETDTGEEFYNGYDQPYGYSWDLFNQFFNGGYETGVPDYKGTTALMMC